MGVHCAGKTVKSLENTCHTWALLRWWFTTKRRYIKCMHLYLYRRFYAYSRCVCECIPIGTQNWARLRPTFPSLPCAGAFKIYNTDICKAHIVSIRVESEAPNLPSPADYIDLENFTQILPQLFTVTLLTVGQSDRRHWIIPSLHVGEAYLPKVGFDWRKVIFFHAIFPPKIFWTRWTASCSTFWTFSRIFFRADCFFSFPLVFQF